MTDEFNPFKEWKSMPVNPCTSCGKIKTRHESGVCALCRVDEKIRANLAADPDYYAKNDSLKLVKGCGKMRMGVL